MVNPSLLFLGHDSCTFWDMLDFRVFPDLWSCPVICGLFPSFHWQTVPTSHLEFQLPGKQSANRHWRKYWGKKKAQNTSSNWACSLQAGAGCMWTAAIHSAVLLKVKSWQHWESWVMWWVWDQGSILCGCQVDGWILDAANFSSAWFASLSSPSAPNAVIQVDHNSSLDLKLLDTQDSDVNLFFSFLKMRFFLYAVTLLRMYVRPTPVIMIPLFHILSSSWCSLTYFTCKTLHNMQPSV